jgi:DNA-binding response OmpR family regulator
MDEFTPNRAPNPNPFPHRLEEIAARKVVLVVDDDSSQRDSLRRTLSKLGVEILDAGSSREALEYLSRGAVDLLIADYRMPSIDGIELVRRARAQTPGIQTLMLTGFGTTEVVLRSLNEAHVDYFIQKPCHTGGLLTLVATLLRLKQGEYAPRVVVGLESIEEGERLGFILEGASMSYERVRSKEEFAQALQGKGNLVAITEGEGREFHGMELVEGMQANRIPRRPLILVCSHVEESDVVRAARLGIRHLVLRPWTDEGLLSRVRELLLSGS